MRKKIIIEKQATETTDLNSNEYFSDSDDISTYLTQTRYVYPKEKVATQNIKTIATQAVQRKNIRGVQNNDLTNIVNTKYKNPISGTIQDKLSKEDIINKLKNYIPLKSLKEKEVLKIMPVYKTWVKYYNKKTRKFRSGGFLLKVMHPDYIVLVNTKLNITWSVQLNEDNIIFIEDPEYKLKRETEKKKEIVIKDKLYELYKDGKLANKK